MDRSLRKDKSTVHRLLVDFGDEWRHAAIIADWYRCGPPAFVVGGFGPFCHKDVALASLGGGGGGGGGVSVTEVIACLANKCWVSTVINDVNYSGPARVEWSICVRHDTVAFRVVVTSSKSGNEKTPIAVKWPLLKLTGKQTNKHRVKQTVLTI